MCDSTCKQEYQVRFECQLRCFRGEDGDLEVPASASRGKERKSSPRRSVLFGYEQVLQAAVTKQHKPEELHRRKTPLSLK
jgi:hypothetical protein